MEIQAKTTKSKMSIYFDGSYNIKRQDEWVYEGKISSMHVYVSSEKFELDKLMNALTQVFPIKIVSEIHLVIDRDMSEISLNTDGKYKLNSIRISNPSNANIDRIAGDNTACIRIDTNMFNYLEGNFYYITTEPPKKYIKVNCYYLSVTSHKNKELNIIDTNVTNLYFEVHTHDAVINCINTISLGKTDIECNRNNLLYRETNCRTKYLSVKNNNSSVATYHLDSKENTKVSLNVYGLRKKIIIKGKSPYGINHIHSNVKDFTEIEYDGNCKYIPDKYSGTVSWIPAEPNILSKPVDNLSDGEFREYITNALEFGYVFNVFLFARVLKLLEPDQIKQVQHRLDVLNDITFMNEDDTKTYVTKLKSYIEENELEYIINEYKSNFDTISYRIMVSNLLTKEWTQFFIEHGIRTYNVFKFSGDTSNQDDSTISRILDIYDSNNPTKYYEVEPVTTIEQFNRIDRRAGEYSEILKLIKIFSIPQYVVSQYALHSGLSGVILLLENKQLSIDNINNLYYNATDFKINNMDIKILEANWKQISEYGIDIKLVLLVLAYNEPYSVFTHVLDKFLNEKMYLSDEFDNYKHKSKIISRISQMHQVEQYLLSQEHDYAWNVLDVPKPENPHKYDSTLVNIMLNLERKKINKNILFRKRPRDLDTIYLDTINEVKAPYNKQSNEYQSLKYAEEQAKNGYISGKLLNDLDNYISINVDEKIKRINTVISEFISKHNKILQNIIDGKNKSKIPKLYKTNNYKFNMVYFELIPKASDIDEWVFARQYMSDKQIKVISYDELTDLYNEHGNNTNIELSEKVFPILTKLSNMTVEERKISISSQSMKTIQQMYRINLTHLNNLTSLCSDDIIIRIKEYIAKGNHPTSKIHLTIGWVRFNIDELSKSIWINEVQTDIKKVLVLTDNATNALTDKILYNTVFSFQQWIIKHYPEYTVVLPGYIIREKILGGNPMPNGYDNPAKKLKFTKGEYSETPWNKVKRNSGLVWTWSPLNEVKSI